MFVKWLSCAFCNLAYSAHITISRWDIHWFHAKVNGNQLLSQNQSHSRPSVANANAKPIPPRWHKCARFKSWWII